MVAQLGWFATADSFWTVRSVSVFGTSILILALLAMAFWRYRSISAIAADLSRTLSERDAARDLSRREEERFRTVVETAYEGIAMIDVSNCISFANRRLRDMVGTDDDLVGRSLWDFVDEDYRAKIRDGLSRRKEGKADTYEVMFRRPDGTGVWILLSVAPLRSEDGAYAGLVATLTDISARVRAESSLGDSERRYRALVEHGSDLISTLGADGRMEYQSPAVSRALGFSPDQLAGRTSFEFMHPDDQAEAGEAWEKMLAHPGQPVRIPFLRIRHADGSWRTLSVTITNMLSDPAVAAVLSNAEDVTLESELERQLVQSQKQEAVGRLAGGIAHDFNNLLTVMRAQTDLLLMEMGPLHPWSTDVVVIQTAADRAATLTSQLLSFSREQVLRPRLVSLGETVRDISGLLERVIGEDVRIRLECDDMLPPVLVDPPQLEQVLLNLAVNARDALPQGGTLTLSTSEHTVGEASSDQFGDIPPGRYVVIEVADTGVGMDKQTMARIFDPFFTTKERGKGTGLGLAMAYGFMRQTGGAIHVTSEAGDGTSFSLWFPASEGEPEPRPQPVSRPFRVAGATRTVLVVEDNDSVRRVIIKTLERAGLVVVSVIEATAALEVIAERDDIDLMLTDLGLPGMSGHELVARVRVTHPRLPILIASGYANESAGSDDLPADIPFIQKPFSVEGLVEAVHNALGDSPLEGVE